MRVGPEKFSEALERAGRWIAAYYDEPGRFPVFSRARPGDLVRALPAEAPELGEPFEAIFADFERLIVPGLTHWNHPRFFAYFAISATPIAVIAETLAAALDVNAMLWRTSPAATELEDVTTSWLARLMGLDPGLHGIIYDTASTGGFTALCAAREALGLDIRERGTAGREDLRALRVYLTEHTHSHLEKAAIALGIGRANVVRVPVDERFAMRPEALAAVLDADRAAGFVPLAVCATVGTTSSTACDDVARVAEVARARGTWLHVDAAYAGPAAILPELRSLLAGTDRADSLVVNPHKWLFVPIDCSVLYVRDLPNLRRTFSLVADYLLAPETDDVRNYNEYGLQLGRRFRALKLWFAMRHFGASGLRDILRAHVALARELGEAIAAEPHWEVLAPYPLSVVCFRYAPPATDEAERDRANLAIVDAVNASGEAFVSSTRLNGRVAVRVAIGNERTERADVDAVWRLLRDAARAVAV